MDEYTFNEQNLRWIIFKKSGKKYSIYNRIPYDKSYTKYIFHLENMKSPFGIEKYNFKEIVNFEFTNHKENNEMFNQVSLIKQLDSFMKNINNNELENSINPVTEDITDKQYMSCLKEKRNFDPLIRVHLKKKSKNTITNFYCKHKNSNIYDIKNKICNITLELGDLWINEYNYGLVIYMSDIEILN